MSADVGFATRLDDAVAPLVLAVDVGSSGSRAGVYDARGLPVRGHRHKEQHAFTAAADGTVVIDADRVTAEVAACLDDVTSRLPAGSVTAVGIDTFASSLVGIGANGTALTPCFTYADSRCAAQVAQLATELDIEQLHDQTGTRLHTSYLAPRLRWLHDTEPELCARVQRWLSLGEYLQLQLAGATAVGTSTAAWSGLLDRRSGTWVPELLGVARVRVDQLSTILDPDRGVPGADTGRRWSALEGASWLAPVPDGVVSNIGCGATDAGTVAVSMATSGALRVLVEGIPAHVPSGLWCYRVSAHQSIFGGAINDVGRALSWLEATLRLPDGVDLDAVAARPPDPETPLMLPFLTGERSTGWRGDARAVITPVAIGDHGDSIARATIEGIALSYKRIYDQLRTVSPNAERVVANGGVSAEVPHLIDIVAGALGLPVQSTPLRRSTLHGTALLSLQVVAPDEPRAAVPVGRRAEPAHTEYFEIRSVQFEDLYKRIYG